MKRAHKCDESYAIHGSALARHFYVGFPISRLFPVFRYLGFGKTKKPVLRKNRYFSVYQKTAPAYQQILKITGHVLILLTVAFEQPEN